MPDWDDIRDYAAIIYIMYLVTSFAAIFFVIAFFAELSIHLRPWLPAEKKAVIRREWSFASLRGGNEEYDYHYG